MDRIERGKSPGEVVRSSRRRLAERKLGEYIAIVESFGYTVTKSKEKPVDEQREETKSVEVIPAEGRPPEPDFSEQEKPAETETQADAPAGPAKKKAVKKS